MAIPFVVRPSHLNRYGSDVDDSNYLDNFLLLKFFKTKFLVVFLSLETFQYIYICNFSIPHCFYTSSIICLLSSLGLSSTHHFFSVSHNYLISHERQSSVSFIIIILHFVSSINLVSCSQSSAWWWGSSSTGWRCFLWKTLSRPFSSFMSVPIITWKSRTKISSTPLAGLLVEILVPIAAVSRNQSWIGLGPCRCTKNDTSKRKTGGVRNKVEIVIVKVVFQCHSHTGKELISSQIYTVFLWLSDY